MLSLDTLRRGGREPSVVVLVGLAISVAFNWPIVRHPKSTIAGDLGDPLLQTWELAWQRHFITDGGSFWTSNLFFPAKDTVAFSDSLLGYLPLALVGDGMYLAVMRYNIAFILAFALAFVGGYALARQLGANWQGAALAGVAFAWAPWRLSHDSHLNILSVGGIALALFALAKGHGYSFASGFDQRKVRPGYIFLGWAIAAWQVSLGFAVGVPFVYAMGIVGLVIAVFMVTRRKIIGMWLIVANGVGMALFLAATYLMSIPYRRAVDDYGLKREWQELVALSPPPQALLTAPDRTWLWRDTYFDGMAELPGPFPGEMLLFPGLVLLVFALAGLLVSAWPARIRVALALAAVIVAIFSLGASVFDGKFTVLLAWEYLPGWDALRTPGRLILWTILFLALLAAGAMTGLARALASWRKPAGGAASWIPVVLAVPALLALLEGVPDRPYATVPGSPPELQRVFAEADGPILVLPADELNNFRYMLWSTDSFPIIANGHTGHLPSSYVEIAQGTYSFPDTSSVEVLKRHGIRTVVAVKSSLTGKPYRSVLNPDVGTLPITRSESSEIVVYTIP